MGAARRREAGGQRLAPAPSRSFPPKRQFQGPTPWEPRPRGAESGGRAVVPPTSSSWNLRTARERALSGRARGMGARAWRPLPATPLYSPRSTAHPGTPGRSGSFASGAGGALCRWIGRVRAAAAWSASRYSPFPAGRGPAARRDRLLLVAAQPLPPLPPPPPPLPRAPAPPAGPPGWLAPSFALLRMTMIF